MKTPNILKCKLWPLPSMEPLNLLEDHLMAECHILVPIEGRSKLFVTKLDQADAQKIMRLTQSIIEAAIDFARLYGVTVQGTIGGGPPQPGQPGGRPAT